MKTGQILRSRFSRFIFSALLVAVSAVAEVRAHTPGLSQLLIEAKADSAEITLQFAPPDPDGDGRLSESELAAGTVLLHRLAPTWFRVTDGRDTLAVIDSPSSFTLRDDWLVWRSRIASPPTGSWRLELLQLSQLSPGHRELVTAVRDATSVVEALLSADNPVLEIVWSQPAGAEDSHDAPSALAGFLKLGIEHIVTGYDHLLYLAGLILICRSLRGIAALITSFTLAHSITLALATLGVVSIPPSIVEPLIAASIVYVGLENLWLQGREPRARWVVAFAFGLIHGFGFAGLLSELGIGENGTSILWPLLSFNLGVELGQLAIVAITLPLLLWAKKASRFETTLLPVASATVVAFGAYWFTQRVWL
jgi:hydrogenase/urease accessory protein HupE